MVPLIWITVACRSSLKPGLCLELSAPILCWVNRYTQFRSHFSREGPPQHIISMLCPLAPLKNILLRNQGMKEKGWVFCFMLLAAKGVSTNQKHTMADL